ncbi:hypothetical protein B0T20DRAFT_352243, partial [Sordaria brevicollis]
IYIIYFNNILIYSNFKEEYNKYLRSIFERLRATQLFAKASKYEFYKNYINFLGYRIIIKGVIINPERVKVI